MNSFDVRVRYTRMIIETSFLELLKTKHVSKITVTELCQKARINRATFYKHYLDIPDLLEKLEENLFSQIRAAFDNRAAGLETFLLEMLTYIQREGRQYMVLGSDNADPNLMTKTFMVCCESAYPLLEKNLPQMEESQRKMLYQFLSHGSGGILTQWVKDGMKESAEEVSGLILRLCKQAGDCFKSPD